MSRDLDTTTDNAAQASHVVPYTLVELDYESGAVRIASTPFDITYDGDTYLGVGRLGSISAIQEGPEQKSYGVSMELSGIPASYFAEMSQERFQDRACRIWVGFLDAESHRPDGAPAQMFGGRMDVVALQLGQTITVTLTAESRLVDWERAPNRRFTDQDQQRAFPGDLGLQFVQATTDMELPWGRG
jgi:hypothetical protein